MEQRHEGEGEQTQPETAFAESPFKGKTGIRRLINAFGYSLAGLNAAFRHEDAFRQETVLAMVLIPVAFFCHTTGIGRALLIGSVLLLLLVELLNSAIEAVVDKASPEWHLLAKRAKDIGSAAVMVSMLNLIIVWVLVLAD